MLTGPMGTSRQEIIGETRQQVDHNGTTHALMVVAMITRGRSIAHTRRKADTCSAVGIRKSKDDQSQQRAPSCNKDDIPSLEPTACKIASISLSSRLKRVLADTKAASTLSCTTYVEQGAWHRDCY